MLLALATVTAQIPVATNLLEGTDVATPDDYPKDMLAAGSSAFVDVRVVVAPTGKPERCDVIAEVGGGFGPLTSTLMLRRAHFGLRSAKMVSRLMGRTQTGYLGGQARACPALPPIRSTRKYLFPLCPPKYRLRR